MFRYWYLLSFTLCISQVKHLITVSFSSNTGQACVATKEQIRLAVIAVAEEMGLSRTEDSINKLTNNMEAYCQETLNRLNLVCGQVHHQSVLMQQVVQNQADLAAQVVCFLFIVIKHDNFSFQNDLNKLLERRDSCSNSSVNDRHGFQQVR